MWLVKKGDQKRFSDHVVKDVRRWKMFRLPGDPEKSCQSPFYTHNPEDSNCKVCRNVGRPSTFDAD
jgi:hypothetical protein